MSLGIVIVTHESSEVLPTCLAGVGRERLGATVVVDNASKDESAELARAAGARVIALKENIGFGRAATLGARSFATRHLGFLNPDCEPTPALFREAVAVLEESPRRCACPTLVEPWGTIPGRQPGYTRTKLLADMVESRFGRRLARGLRRLPWHDDTSWSWPHGACLFIDRSLFEELGGFDAAYFLYMEDVDLGRRVARAGGEVVALSERVMHRGGRGARIARDHRRGLLDAGRVLYGRRVYGRRFGWLLQAVATLGRNR